MTEPVIVYIGLGSNVGDRLGYLRTAVARLVAEAGIELAGASSVYETTAVGPPQDDFLNAVVRIRTVLGPVELLDRLRATERAVGRRPRERWGPREIDLDLLLYGEEILDEPGLRVPHPEMAGRAFVLVPLTELDPSVLIPGHASAGELARRAGTGGVRRSADPGALIAGR